METLYNCFLCFDKMEAPLDEVIQHLRDTPNHAHVVPHLDDPQHTAEENGFVVKSEDDPRDPETGSNRVNESESMIGD